MKLGASPFWVLFKNYSGICARDKFVCLSNCLLDLSWKCLIYLTYKKCFLRKTKGLNKQMSQFWVLVIKLLCCTWYFVYWDQRQKLLFILFILIVLQMIFCTYNYYLNNILGTILTVREHIIAAIKLHSLVFNFIPQSYLLLGTHHSHTLLSYVWDIGKINNCQHPQSCLSENAYPPLIYELLLAFLQPPNNI